MPGTRGHSCCSLHFTSLVPERNRHNPSQLKAVWRIIVQGKASTNKNHKHKEKLSTGLIYPSAPLSISSAKNAEVEESKSCQSGALRRAEASNHCILYPSSGGGGAPSDPFTECRGGSLSFRLGVWAPGWWLNPGINTLYLQIRICIIVNVASLRTWARGLAWKTRLA